MEGKYDIHCTCLSKIWRPIIYRSCLMPWYFLSCDERRKQHNKYTRLELKYYCWYCWVAFNYAPSFYFHLEMYCLRIILWSNLASSRVAIVKTCWWPRLDNSDLKGLFCSKGWNVFLAMEWMKTKCLCHGSSFCDYRGCKHQPVNCRSIVFSSHSKKSFIQLHCLKALFKLLLILLFYSKP